MFNALKSFFHDPEPVDLPPTDASTYFQEQREQELGRARDRASDHVDAVSTVLEDVEEALEQLANYSDDKGRTAVEDIVDNFYQDRKRLLNRFELPEDVEQVYEDIDAFIEEFRTMKQKEIAVLQNTVAASDDVFAALRELEDRHKQVEHFLDTTYQTMERYETVQDLVDEITTIREEITALEQERDSINPSTVTEQINAKEAELEAHAEKKAWDEKERIRNQIETLRTKQKEIETDIEKTRSKLERGLKKLVYAAEHDDVSLEPGVVGALRDIRDGSLDAIDDIPAVIDAATDAVQKHSELLDERQRTTFLDAAEIFQQIDGQFETLNRLAEEQQSLREKLTRFTLEDERQTIKREIEKLQDKRRQKAEKRQAIREQIQAKQDVLTAKRQEIENLLNAEFTADITVGSSDA